MKRRLISQRDSLTITLPKDWITFKNLKPGDEIDISQSGEVLMLNSLSNKKKKEFELEISTLNDECIRNTLNSLYVCGATKLILRSDKPSKLLLCKKLTSLFLVGFEVSEEYKGEIALEALAISDSTNLENYFDKIWNILDSDFKILKGEDFGDKADISEEIKRGTKKLTQYCNICDRILLETIYNDSQKAIKLRIIQNLKEINHLIFHLFEKKDKVSKEMAEVLEEIFLSIRRGYFKEEIESINKSQELINKNLKKLENNIFLFSISRELYRLSNSVLGVIFK
ncbi:MAG: hypothetical protein WCI72_02605 [archaeon]